MFLPRPTLALALALVFLGAPPVHAGAEVPGAGSLELPGSAASLAQAMGLDPSTPRARLMIEVIRQVHAALPAQCPDCEAARQRLLAWPPADAGPGGGDDRTVPLPWSAETWRGLLGQRPEPLALAILRDRQAALVYHGLMSVDADTRAYLERQPKLRQRLYERLAASFAAFGRSLPIRDGVVALPGGPGAAPVWEDLVGERAADPESFVAAALGKANGRLAYFLDTVAHLDPAQRAFALSLWEPDPGRRASRVRALFKAFVDVQPEWRIADRPFARPLVDPALVLLTVRATPEGRFSAPDDRGFWELVFRDQPAGPEEIAKRVTQPVDAAWIVGQTVTLDVVTGRERLAAVSFVQRRFASAPAGQTAAVVRAGHAFLTHRAAMIAVERTGLADPAGFARVADVVASLSTADAAAATAQLQAVLALLERLRGRAALSPGHVLQLLDSLAVLPIDPDGRYHGRLTAWVDAQLMAALGFQAPVGEAERALVGALAGRRPDAGPGPPGVPSPTVTWEGVAYHVDVAGTEQVRLERVRSRQAGNALGAGLDLARRALVVAGARTPAELQIACARTVALSATLAPVPWPAPGIDTPLVSPGKLVADRCEDLKAVTTPGDLSASSTRELARELADVADAVVTDTLVSIVYALHVGDPAGAIDLAPDLARRHRFATSDRVGLGKGAPAWSLPRERVGTGVAWHVEGALLGLEHALAGLSLRLLAGQEMPEAPRLNRNERATLALGLALMNPFALRDTERDAIVAAVARGRARLETPERLAAEVQSVGEEAGWSEWRREAIRWALAGTPSELPSLLTLADYFWAGWGTGSADALDGWGAAMTPLEGDLRLAWPAPRPWEELAGRSANGQLATRFVDLTLRVADTLVQHHLPAALAPSLLAPALADLIHEAPLGHADDWHALAAWVARVPDDRLLDYIASLAAGGPLVPVSDDRP